MPVRVRGAKQVHAHVHLLLDFKFFWSSLSSLELGDELLDKRKQLPAHASEVACFYPLDFVLGCVVPVPILPTGGNTHAQQIIMREGIK